MFASLTIAEAKTLAAKLSSGANTADLAWDSMQDADYGRIARDLRRLHREVMGNIIWIGY